MTDDRRCLVMGTFNMDARAWSGVTWEFADVIARIERADILAPPDRFYNKDNPTARPPLRDRLDARLRRTLRQYVPRMPVVKVDGDYDLTIFVCQFAYEINEIARFKDWRERSRKAAIFILEAWPSDFPAQSRTLRKLDLFDHVFLLNGAAVPALARYTSTPVSQLSTAADVVRATPVPDHPARVVDICCIGRNQPQVHAELLTFARQKGFLYLHDIWRNQNVAESWDAVRRYNADLVRRSRYYLVWNPALARQHQTGSRRRNDVLSTRYFEGAAGGAVLLGSAPDCPEYHAAFDWPDALVPLSQDPAPVIQALDADPDRVARIRAANTRQCLLRHDWCHRWRDILHTFNLHPTQAHVDRELHLAVLAGEVPIAVPTVVASQVDRQAPEALRQTARFVTRTATPAAGR
jgi:hypothetical protein